MSKQHSSGRVAFTVLWRELRDLKTRLLAFGVTTGQQGALAGTDGTPSAANPFVTDTDPRLTASGLPVVDTTSIVEDPGDATKEMRIDVGAVATATVRVLTMPNADVDLTANTGTFPAAAHQARHNSGGADALKLDDLAAPDDNTDLNATTGAHGLLRKLDNASTNFLNGQGNWAVPPGGSGPTVILKAADESVTSSTTLQDDDELTISIAAFASYVLDFVLFFEGATTGDIKFNLTVPSGAQYRIGALANLVASSGNDSNVRNVATNSSGFDLAFGTAGAANPICVSIRGVVIADATAGSVTLQWAQNTSSGTATMVLQNSLLIATPF